jgi:hypothetical protein
MLGLIYPLRRRKSAMHKIAVVLLVLFVFGCADSHRVSPTNKSSEKLSSSEFAYVVVPQDGRYGATNYTGSGQTVAQIVASAFAKHINRVEIGQKLEQPDAVVANAQELGATYLVTPMIVHWEDRATEWSLKSDKVEVKITVHDVASGRMLASAVVSGSSGLATFGGDHPQDLLPEPMDSYVGSLF